MARIPDEVLARLKREVPLARVVEAAGIALKRQGDNLVGHCGIAPIWRTDLTA